MERKKERDRYLEREIFRERKKKSETENKQSEKER